MALHDLKKELVSFIENSDNENLLSLLKEDISFYANHMTTDVTDSLNEQQLGELKALAEEPDEKDTMSFQEFRAATERWRIK